MEEEKLIITCFKDKEGGIISQMRNKSQDTTLAMFILAVERKLEELKKEYHKGSIDEELEFGLRGGLNGR